MKNKVVEQRIFALTICIMSFIPAIHQFVNLFCKQMFGGTSLDTLLTYGSLLVFVFLTLKIVAKHIKKDVLLLFLFLCTALMVSYAFFPENREFMSGAITDYLQHPLYKLFVYSFMGYVAIRYLDDYNELWFFMQLFAVAAVVGSLGTYLIMKSNELQPAYMQFSYNLLLPVTVLMISFLEKRRFLTFIFFIIGFLLMFFCGARGPLLCVVIALLLYILLNKGNSVHKFITVFFILLAGLFLFTTWPLVLEIFVSIAEDLGIESRTVDMLVSNEISSDSGRGMIISMLFEDYNYFGEGLFGDRVVLDGGYAHNLFYELIYQWGVVLGSFLSLIIIVLLLFGMFSKENQNRMLVIIFMTAGFMKLLMSSSYLIQEPAFFIMIALCVNSVIRNGISLISLRSKSVMDRNINDYDEVENDLLLEKQELR